MFEILKKKYPSYHIILIFHNQLPNFWSWETFKRSKDTVVAKHSKFMSKDLSSLMAMLVP